MDQNSIKDLAFDLGNKIENLFLLVGTEVDGKAFLTCFIAKNLVEEKQLDAGKVVRKLGVFIQGGGGGQAYFATAGGKKPEGIELALDYAPAKTFVDPSVVKIRGKRYVDWRKVGQKPRK